MKKRIMIGGQTNVSEWYAGAFPTDTLGEELNRGITFQDVFECLQVGFNVYALLGVNDSIVRERVFDALATAIGASYDHVYYQWLNGTKRPLGYRVYDDMNGLRFNNE